VMQVPIDWQFADWLFLGWLRLLGVEVGIVDLRKRSVLRGVEEVILVVGEVDGIVLSRFLFCIFWSLV